MFFNKLIKNFLKASYNLKVKKISILITERVWLRSKTPTTYIFQVKKRGVKNYVGMENYIFIKKKIERLYNGTETITTKFDFGNISDLSKIDPYHWSLPNSHLNFRYDELEQVVLTPNSNSVEIVRYILKSYQGNLNSVEGRLHVESIHWHTGFAPQIRSVVDGIPEGQEDLIDNFIRGADSCIQRLDLVNKGYTNNPLNLYSQTQRLDLVPSEQVFAQWSRSNSQLQMGEQIALMDEQVGLMVKFLTMKDFQSCVELLNYARISEVLTFVTYLPRPCVALPVIGFAAAIGSIWPDGSGRFTQYINKIVDRLYEKLTTYLLRQGVFLYNHYVEIAVVGCFATLVFEWPVIKGYKILFSWLFPHPSKQGTALIGHVLEKAGEGLLAKGIEIKPASPPTNKQIALGGIESLFNVLGLTVNSAIGGAFRGLFGCETRNEFSKAFIRFMASMPSLPSNLHGSVHTSRTITVGTDYPSPVTHIYGTAGPKFPLPWTIKPEGPIK